MNVWLQKFAWHTTRRIHKRLPNIQIVSRLLPDAWITKKNFYLINGFLPNLRDPKGFHEKICWIKLHGITHLHKICSNKITARGYVAERLGSGVLVPEILMTQDVNDLNPNRIKNSQFIVKANHDSGSAIICRDRENFDWDDARKRMKKSLERDYYMYQRERQYEGFERVLIVEELLQDRRGELPHDIRVYCFHGQAKLIRCTSKNADGASCSESYDREWNRLPLQLKNKLAPDSSYPKPERLSDIINMAETLTEPFIFCRVDFYELEGSVFFAEMTFVPSAGNSQFSPPEDELKIGSWLKLK